MTVISNIANGFIGLFNAGGGAVYELGNRNHSFGYLSDDCS